MNYGSTSFMLKYYIRADNSSTVECLLHVFFNHELNDANYTLIYNVV